MKINVYIIGRITEKFYKEAISEYDKRLGKYCKIKLIEVKAIDNLTKLLGTGHTIRVSSKGSMLSSEELATKINEFGISGVSEINFVYSEQAIDSKEHLAISNMDFDLGLSVVIIYEQIYRAHRIIHNHAYHK